jgi:hypothetical protein
LAQVLEAGTLSPAQAATDRRAHTITAWLGEHADQVAAHVVTIEPDGPGVIVVCTDGLWNYLDTVEELAAALPAQAFEAPLDAARRLVEIALQSGGRDNITVAVLPFVGASIGTSVLALGQGGDASTQPARVGHPPTQRCPLSAPPHQAERKRSNLRVPVIFGSSDWHMV